MVFIIFTINLYKSKSGFINTTITKIVMKSNIANNFVKSNDGINYCLIRLSTIDSIRVLIISAW